MGMGEWVGEDVLLIGSDKWVWRLPDSNKSEEKQQQQQKQPITANNTQTLPNQLLHVEWVDVSLFDYY